MRVRQWYHSLICQVYTWGFVSGWNWWKRTDRWLLSVVVSRSTLAVYFVDVFMHLLHFLPHQRQAHTLLFTCRQNTWKDGGQVFAMFAVPMKLCGGLKQRWLPPCNDDEVDFWKLKLLHELEYKVMPDSDSNWFASWLLWQLSNIRVMMHRKGLLDRCCRGLLLFGKMSTCLVDI